MSERNGYPQGTPCWADISTSDPDAARAFYAGLFGWEWEVNPDPAYGGYSIATLRGKRIVGLGPKMDDNGPTAWMTYFAVDDAAAVAATVPAAGGALLMPVMPIADQGVMAIAADPAGAVFGLWQQGVHRGSELVNEPGTVVWNELVAPEIEKEAEFYATVLGLTMEDLAPDSPDADASMPVYKLLKVGGRTAGGAMPPMPGMAGMPPHWGIYFEVADADAAATTAQELGATLLSPVQPTPQGPMATLADPQGGPFAIIASGSTE
jgi:predicted enzyme related to lactoylglutathione lyase